MLSLRFPGRSEVCTVLPARQKYFRPLLLLTDCRQAQLLKRLCSSSSSEQIRPASHAEQTLGECRPNLRIRCQGLKSQVPFLSAEASDLPGYERCQGGRAEAQLYLKKRTVRHARTAATRCCKGASEQVKRAALVARTMSPSTTLRHFFPTCADSPKPKFFLRPSPKHAHSRPIPLPMAEPLSRCFPQRHAVTAVGPGLRKADGELREALEPEEELHEADGCLQGPAKKSSPHNPFSHNSLPVISFRHSQSIEEVLRITASLSGRVPSSRSTADLSRPLGIPRKTCCPRLATPQCGCPGLHRQSMLLKDADFDCLCNFWVARRMWSSHVAS